MSHDDMRAAVLKALTDIAPEIDPAEVAPDEDFRETYELDSMDFLNLLGKLYERYGVDVPETDVARLGSIDAIAAYFERHLEAAEGRA